jgi:hypothetical protein
MVKFTTREMIRNIQDDIECMKESIRYDFACIAITQGHMRIAHNAIAYHEQQQRLDDLVYFCVNGSYPDE